MASGRKIALPAAALAAVAALAALTGCGGASASGAGAGAGRLLADTFGSGAGHIRSGDLTVALGVRATGFATFKGPVAIRLSGPFETRPGALPRFDFDLSFASAGSTIAAGAVSTGSKGYLKLGGHAYVLPDAAFKRFANTTASKNGSGIALKSLGIDPRRWVKDVKDVGEADVGGVRTIHLTAGVDGPRLLGDLGTVFGKTGALALGGTTSGSATGLDAPTRAKIARSIRHARVDIWTGKRDHALRRLALDVRFDVPAGLRPKGSAAQKGELRLELTIAGVNQPQPIGAPANPRPLADLTAAIQQLAAKAQGAASGAAAAAPSSGGSKYDACIAKAGADLGKIQTCSALLGQ